MEGKISKDQDKKPLALRVITIAFQWLIQHFLLAFVAAIIIAAIIYIFGGEEKIIEYIKNADTLLLVSITLNIVIIFVALMMLNRRITQKSEGQLIQNTQTSTQGNLLNKIQSKSTEKHVLPEIIESIKHYNESIPLLLNPEKPWSLNINNQKLHELEIDAKTLAFKYTNDPNVELTQFTLIVTPYRDDVSPVRIWFYYFTTSRLELVYSYEGSQICLHQKPTPCDSVVYFEKNKLPWKVNPKWDELLYTAFHVIKPITKEGYYWLVIKAAPPQQWELYIRDRKEQYYFSWGVDSSPEDYKPYIE